MDYGLLYHISPGAIKPLCGRRGAERVLLQVCHRWGRTPLVCGQARTACMVLSGMRGVFAFCVLYLLLLGGRFRASKAAESRRGDAKKARPPGPLLLLCGLGERLPCGAAPVAGDSFEFPLKRKESPAKSSHCFLASCAAAAGRRGNGRANRQPRGCGGDGRANRQPQGGEGTVGLDVAPVGATMGRPPVAN